MVKWLKLALEQLEGWLIRQKNIPPNIAQQAVSSARDAACDTIRSGVAERMAPSARRRWLRVVGIRAAYTVMRRKRPCSLPEGDTLASPHMTRIDTHEMELVQRALNEVKGQEHAAITAIFYDRLSRRKAAELLGIPVGTLAHTLRRGLSQLRESIERLRREF